MGDCDRRDRKEYHRQYYYANRERINQGHADWYQRNRDKMLQQHAEYRQRQRGMTYSGCGDTITFWQKTCKRCRPVETKPCLRCGEMFEPVNNYRKICDACRQLDNKYATYTARAGANDPCTKCNFLERCKLEIRELDGWPLCWVISPERETFIQMYIGEESLQGSLARTLLKACEMEGRGND